MVIKDTATGKYYSEWEDTGGPGSCSWFEWVDHLKDARPFNIDHIDKPITYCLSPRYHDHLPETAKFVRASKLALFSEVSE